MVHHHRQDLVFSVDRVRSELLAGRKKEDLVQWVWNKVPDGVFVLVDTEPVVRGYTDVMLWMPCHPKSYDHAKAKFVTGADGWLVACARIHSAAVVTNERSAAESKRKIKLRDVRDQFGVQRDHAFAMPRALNVQFKWAGDG